MFMAKKTDITRIIFEDISIVLFHVIATQVYPAHVAALSFSGKHTGDLKPDQT